LAAEIGALSKFSSRVIAPWFVFKTIIWAS